MSDGTAEILIIDDDPFFQQVLSDAFKESGYTVHVASDGMEGVKMYQDRQPEVVISDLVMPRMGGVSTCLEIARIAGDKQPVIIMLTSMFQETAHEHATPEMGARFHIPKSTPPLDVVILVEQLIARNKSQTPAP